MKKLGTKYSAQLFYSEYITKHLKTNLFSRS